MVGITLSPEQIRTAPPEVRRWLEREIEAALGMHLGPGTARQPDHLVGCGPEEAAAVYAAIRGMPPVVNVFFELGREGERVDRDGIAAFRVADLIRHAHLDTIDQLSACLGVINDALRRVSGDANATVFALDPRGYCIIASRTQQSVRSFWKQLIATQAASFVAPGEVASAMASQPPTDGAVAAPVSAHLGNIVSTPRQPATANS